VVHPSTDYPGRFATGQQFFTSGGRVLTVASATPVKDGVLVTFDGISDRNSAEALSGETLMIEDRHRRSLGHDEYWPDQLVGLRARSSNGEPVGVVESVDDSGPQPRLIVRTDRGLVLIPLVTALVTAIDIDAGLVTIDPIEGLLEPSDSE
jgi:16S rRNA processing protein RimM